MRPPESFDDDVTDDGLAEVARRHESTQHHEGSWWEDLTTWLGQHAGPDRDAPTAAGGPGFPPLGPAPGTYVLAR